MSAPVADLLVGASSRMPPVGLADLAPPTETLVRTDRKYFVPVPALERLLDDLSGQYAVLDIDGRRLFGYRSTYYDDSALGCYRAHLQRRRRRWKVRTRTYVDSGLSMLEVKLRIARGQTLKARADHPGAHRAVLDEPSWSFVSSVVAQRYGTSTPDELGVTIRTDYRRATFVRLHDLARVTVDIDVRCGLEGRGVVVRSDHALVETKSPAGSGSADRALRALGVRPVSMSKYCVGVAAVRPDLPSNPWHTTMRRYFTADSA